MLCVCVCVRVCVCVCVCLRGAVVWVYVGVLVRSEFTILMA